MRITVVGAGAMGSLFGALLSQCGQDVLLVDKRSDHIQAINKNGLSITHPDSSETVVTVKASTDTAGAGHTDLLLLFVKSYDTEQALQDCFPIVGADTVVLTLQNGLGNIEKISRIVGPDKVIAGTTSYGCCALGAGHIAVSNAGEVTLGEIGGTLSTRIRKIAAIFKAAGIQIQVSENIESIIWTKLAVNVGINALTAITALRNGQLLAQAETKQLMSSAIHELVQIAEQKKIKLLTDPIELAFKVAQATSSNKSSMRQDIERGTRTEIDSINGAIVAEGMNLGIATPVNQVLTLLIKALENKVE
ncbi:2-dehydropantoate 2-reductase [bacterium BFN5]|nr:2-dehydropantoate 2-reductase [bacterium BFN5]QJW44669.1 2-dehydropantoate 2-reductase [bacterium BFN5]